MSLIGIGIQYGLGGLAIAICIWLALKVHNQDLKIKSLTDRMKVKDTLCETRQGYFSKVFGRLDIIEKKYIEVVERHGGRFLSIDIKLDHLSSEMKEIKADLKTITLFFKSKE